MKNTKPSRAASVKRRRPPKSVDEYFAQVPDAGLEMMNQLRGIIRSAVPKTSSETISYGIPAFKDRQVLVWYAAFADHCSLFPTAAVIETCKNALEGLATSKGTVQFPLDK